MTAKQVGARSFLAFLRRLQQSGEDHFLEGGQAVNFWAEFFSARGASEKLRIFQPFTSKDCDIWVSFPALEYVATASLGGSFVRGNSPVDGQLGIVQLPGDPPLEVDLFSSVYGIPISKMNKTRKRVVEVNEIRILDPISLFQSKAHCLVDLEQMGRQDGKHFGILCKLIPYYFKMLIEKAENGEIEERNLINELKFLQKILKISKVKRALIEVGVN